MTVLKNPNTSLSNFVHAHSLKNKIGKHGDESMRK